MENVRFRVGCYSHHSILHETIYCHLAELNEDVNAQNEDFPNTEDYLHRTAINQVLAFSVLALESAQGYREWREVVVETREIWDML